MPSKKAQANQTTPMSPALQIKELERQNDLLLTNNIKLVQELKALKASKLLLTEPQKNALCYLESYFEATPQENIKDMQLHIHKLYVWASESRYLRECGDKEVLETSDLVQDLSLIVESLDVLFRNGLPFDVDLD